MEDSSARRTTRPHLALCVTSDPRRSRALRRTLQAVGAQAQFASADALRAWCEPAPDLLVLDRACRADVELVRRSPQLASAKLVLLGEPLSEANTVELLRHQRLDHVIADGGEEEDDDLVVTAVKLTRGDIFGLEKYVSWGVLVREQRVTGYDDKRDALAQLGGYAKEAGARRQLMMRIESVADELLMNGLYDAPAAHARANGAPGHPGPAPEEPEPVTLRYACDGRYFALSVRDNYGALTKTAILDNLTRARSESGNPRAVALPGQGAGLGIYFIVSSTTRFIANIAPGRASEVICLFDFSSTGRKAAPCAQSLHVFSTDDAA